MKAWERKAIKRNIKSTHITLYKTQTRHNKKRHIKIIFVSSSIENGGEKRKKEKMCHCCALSQVLNNVRAQSFFTPSDLPCGPEREMASPCDVRLGWACRRFPVVADSTHNYGTLVLMSPPPPFAYPLPPPPRALTEYIMNEENALGQRVTCM